MSDRRDVPLRQTSLIYRSIKRSTDGSKSKILKTTSENRYDFEIKSASFRQNDFAKTTTTFEHFHWLFFKLKQLLRRPTVYLPEMNSKWSAGKSGILNGVPDKPKNFELVFLFSSRHSFLFSCSLLISGPMRIFARIKINTCIL